MKRVYEYLKENHPFYLATMNGDHPEVRAIGTIAIFEDKLYFQTGMCKEMYKQIEANPNIAICASGNGTWIRINGIAEIDKRDEASAAVLDQFPRLKERYAAGDGNCVVIAITNATARFCSHTAPEEIVTF